MEELNRSLYRPYSLGIVVKAKEPGSDIIYVTPIEELSIQDTGMVSDLYKDHLGNKDGVDGNNFNSQHSAVNYVQARWKSEGRGNRISAPDVQPNEEVMLYKYGNVDQYFWEEMGREPSLRRLEDVLYSFSNLSGGVGKEAFDKDSSYWVRVSTRDKYVHIHTSDNDGEACTFDLKIDTGEGVIRLEDGLGNFMNWDAVAGIHETNFNTQIIRRAPHILDETETHTINTDSYYNNASQTIVETTVARISNSLSHIDNTLTHLLNAAGTSTTDSPSITLTGDTDIGMNLTVALNIKLGGALMGPGVVIPASGPASFDSILKSLDVETPAVKSLNDHVHVSKFEGGDTSPPNG